MEQPIIAVKNLRKVYNLGKEKVVALDCINLEIPKGQICCILGTSGSGKSTFLNQLAGLEKPTKGGVYINGTLSLIHIFRLFHNCLHMTPVEYIKSYRLQMACQMLARGREPVTSIAQACGLGSSSYFGKVFREQTGCTPSEYRQKWQDHDSRGQC